MADQQQLAPGAEHQELDPNATDPNAVAPDDQGGDDNNEPETPAEVAALAEKMGWVPRDRYTGPAEQWKPADQFILDGRDIQRETARELKTLRSTVETIGRTSASIVEQEVNRRVGELTERYNDLVEEGKGAEAFKVAEQISALRNTPVAPTGAPPEAQTWAEDNKAWFNDNEPLAKARAIQVTQVLAGQGYDTETQLREARKTVEREFPHLFGGRMNGHKPAPQVHQPGGRAPNGGGNRERGYADMPKAARDIADDMVARGVIPSKDAYAKNYWQNAEGKR